MGVSLAEADAPMSVDTFRAAVREWLAANFSPDLIGQDFVAASFDRLVELTPAQARWKEAMGAKGWGVPRWPARYGGGGLDADEAAVLAEEMRRIGAWNPIGGMGVMMFGPTLLESGTEEQKARHLPPIARGEIRWCQGYSEPGAGSDLAALQCRAEDRGDHFLVNGQKTWTSGAQWSDWCFALVRTDPREKYEGISFLLIDMRSPGVVVRPIRMISGSSPFGETFFTDVAVPKENLVGALGQGWTIGKRLLQHERGGIGGDRGPPPRKLGDIARDYLPTDAEGRLLDSDLRMRIVRHEMAARAFALTVARVARESGAASTASSILKNVAARNAQERAELTIEIMGNSGLGWEGAGFAEDELAATRGWLHSKAVSIYGGSAEVQNNIIAKRILGLRDHQ